MALRFSGQYSAGHHLVPRAIQRYGEGRGWTWRDVWGQYFLDYDKCAAQVEAGEDVAEWPMRPLPFELTQAVAEEEARHQKAGVYLTAAVFDRRDRNVWGETEADYA